MSPFLTKAKKINLSLWILFLFTVGLISSAINFSSYSEISFAENQKELNFNESVSTVNFKSKDYIDQPLWSYKSTFLPFNNDKINSQNGHLPIEIGIVTAEVSSSLPTEIVILEPIRSVGIISKIQFFTSIYILDDKNKLVDEFTSNITIDNTSDVLISTNIITWLAKLPIEENQFSNKIEKNFSVITSNMIKHTFENGTIDYISAGHVNIDWDSNGVSQLNNMIAPSINISVIFPNSRLTVVNILVTSVIGIILAVTLRNKRIQTQ